MNRMQEYSELTAALEAEMPELREAVRKARARRKRSLRLRPPAGIAAGIALFVLLVNFCAPVAHACTKVPVLRELAAAVTFSRSLSSAVENEYVQRPELTQTQNGITAELAYLIADRKQVNFFYRLHSDRHARLEAEAGVLTADGEHPEACILAWDPSGEAEGGLRRLTVDFIDADVPGALRVRLRVYAGAPEQADGAPAQQTDAPPEERQCLAEFDFPVEFDPAATAGGKLYPVGQTVELNGQRLTVAQLEVYPTHVRVEVEEHPENTAWLKRLDFRLETDGGQCFEPVSNGITATGNGDSPAMTSYRADSSYFYGARHIRLVITGAKWLQKDMERVRVELRTGETGALPEGAALESAVRSGNDWTLTFRASRREGEPMYQLFGSTYYDADGRAYDVGMSSAFGAESIGDTGFSEQFTLRDYPYDEVWLCPTFSFAGRAEKEITVTVR